MIVVDDWEEHNERIDKEVERKKSDGKTRIFFDYSIEFSNPNHPNILKNWLEEKYLNVEMRRCKFGRYDIIFYF